MTTLVQWRTQDFKVGGVEASREVGRGYPPPHWGRVWEGRRAPSPENFSYFLVENTIFAAFWHVYFLNHTPMGGVLTPLTLSSVRQCTSIAISVTAVVFGYVIVYRYSLFISIVRYRFDVT